MIYQPGISGNQNKKKQSQQWLFTVFPLSSLEVAPCAYIGFFKWNKYAFYKARDFFPDLKGYDEVSKIKPRVRKKKLEE